MPTIKIFKGGMVRFRKEIQEAGFRPGTEAEYLKNGRTITLIVPGTTLPQLSLT